MVKLMKERFNSDPRDIVAVIGPTIGNVILKWKMMCDNKEEFGYMEGVIKEE